jgi:rubrerythrin
VEKAAELGHNQTGTQLSPEFTDKQLEAAENFFPDVPGDATSIALARQTAYHEADNIGSVPVPGSTKGKLKSGFDKLLGHQPELLVDKLGERLAFERTGVRLYDAMLAKVAATGDDQHNMGEQLRKIRDEELAHMKLVKAAIEILGADPTAMTPCADVAGVAASGIMQVLTDPRTNISQCLNALLTLELTDNAAWELLVDLTEKAGHLQISKDFEQALEQENLHLLLIKKLLKRELEVQS